MEEKEVKRESLLDKIKRREAETDDKLKQLDEEIEMLLREIFKGKYKKEEREKETALEQTETEEQENEPVVMEKRGSLLENIKRREAEFDAQLKQLNEKIEVLQKKVLKRKDKKVVVREEEVEIVPEVTEPPKRKETFLDEVEKYAAEFDEKLKKMKEEIEEIVEKAFRKRRK